MKFFLPRFAILGLIAGLVPNLLPAQPIGADIQAGGEILTRGPVHEAFAGVVSYNPEAGLIVDVQPPEPIEELPPEERPVDADAAWIPGYWGWDDERHDFIWISGTWRVLPPGRAWIAGYWRDAGRGWQWVSGYWEDAGRREVTYLEPPPETLERGPSSPQPSPAYEWVPGYWEWQYGRYLWRPGYWMEGRIDWVWVPSYYVWTPRGYVFVDGYWDYAPAERGLLFAPVYYRDYRRPRFEYRPSIVLNVAILSEYLFLRPRYSHYYFGDYYDSRYESSGIFATFTYQSSRHGYDPFYSYSRWRHRDDRDWDQRYRASYEYRRRNEDARPPRTYSGSTMVVNINQNITQVGGGGGRRETVTYAQPIQQYAQSSDAPVRIERSATASAQQDIQIVRQVQEQRMQRRTMESQQGALSPSPQTGTVGAQTPRERGPAGQQSVATQEAARVAMPSSPIVARERSGGRQPPPPRGESSRRDEGAPPRQSERSATPGTIGARPAQPDNSAAREAQRQQQQMRQEQRQSGAPDRRIAAPPAQAPIGADPRSSAPESVTLPPQQSEARGAERSAQARERAAEERRVRESQERATQGPPQQIGVTRGERPGREQERQDQQRAQQQQEVDARQAQAREQSSREQQRAQEQQMREQSRAAEHARDEQARASEQAQAGERQAQAAEQARAERARGDQAQQQAQEARQAREQQAQAQQAQQAQAQQAREQQAQAQQAREQQGREQQAQAQQAREQQGREQQAQAQQAREQESRAAEQARDQQANAAQQAEAARQNAAANRAQNQPPPKKAPPPKAQSEEERKKTQDEEEERKKGKRGE